MAMENLGPASLPDAFLTLPGPRAAPVGIQADRERPGRHVCLTPDVPDCGRIRSPFHPRRRLELKEADVAGHLVVSPWIELAFADSGIEKPVTRNAVPAGRIVDRGNDPLLPAYLASWDTEDSQHPTNEGAKKGTTLHEYRSI